MNPLTPSQRRTLRAQAHHLDPVVIIGQHGLTAPVAHEIDLALLKHELIKVRVFSDEREVREALLEKICADLTCARVQHLGKIFVLWRPNPDKKIPKPPIEAKDRRKAAVSHGAVRKTGPRAPVDPVRERRRTARGDESPTTGGKGRRGAARHALASDPVVAPPAADLPRKKSSYTPRTKPKSHSAKPNPRTAWEKPDPTAAPATRRRRTTR